MAPEDVVGNFTGVIVPSAVQAMASAGRHTFGNFLLAEILAIGGVDAHGVLLCESEARSSKSSTRLNYPPTQTNKEPLKLQEDVLTLLSADANQQPKVVEHTLLVLNKQITLHISVQNFTRIVAHVVCKIGGLFSA